MIHRGGDDELPGSGFAHWERAQHYRNISSCKHVITAIGWCEYAESNMSRYLKNASLQRCAPTPEYQQAAQQQREPAGSSGGVEFRRTQGRVIDHVDATVAVGAAYQHGGDI
jgi:hypothetical protein